MIPVRHVIVLSLLAPLAALAQTAAQPAPAKEAPVDLERYIVQGTKQAADLQTVPVSVGIMTGTEIEASRITNFTTATEYLPNVRYSELGGRGVFGFITLRGQANTFTSLDPAATLYIDGVPYSDFYSLDQNLFDIERIEVLRGPQGTLYGGFSEAGVIVVQSRAPDDTTRATLKASYGSSNRYNTTVVGSGPLVSGKLFASVAANVSGGDPLVDNLAAKLGRESAWSIRARLRWKPTDRLELNLISDVQHTDDTTGYLTVPTDIAGYNAALAAVGSPLRVGKFERASDFQGYRKTDMRRHAFTAQWSGEESEIVTTAAWRKNKPDYAFDLDETVFPFLTANAEGTYLTEFYSEARWQTKPSASRAWDGLMGVSYDRGFQQQNSGADDLTGAFGVPPGTHLIAYETTLRSPLVGIFGQATWHTSDRKTGITAGVRYDSADREAYQAPGGFIGAGFTASKATSAVLPKVAVDYAISSRHSIYASIAAGWKPGGANIYAPDISLAPYKAERSWTYEVGSKWRSEDGKLRANTAIFYTDIRDYQDSIYLTPLTQYLGNADRVGITGGELEISATPVQGLDLNLALGFARGRFRDYVRNPNTGYRFDGRRLTDIPDWDLSFTANYRWGKGWVARAEFIASGDIEASRFTAADSASGTPDRLETAMLDGQRVINLRFGYETNRWSAFVGVGNLTNQEYFTQTQSRAPGGYSGFMGAVGPRRLIDCTLQWKL
ncbi:MAG TPA: TonB-dependent receptor [Lacunisphaera sp.]|nr:TonB-dependent receptor [Lacunisphaera sp.]